MTTAIIILNDGETYSDLEGCTMVVLTEAGAAKLEQSGSLSDLEDKDIVLEVSLVKGAF